MLVGVELCSPECVRTPGDADGGAGAMGSLILAIDASVVSRNPCGEDVRC